MDLLQEYTPYLLQAYQTSEPYIQPVLTPVLTTITTLRQTTYPLLVPYLNTALQYAQQQPAIVSVVVFLFILFVALKVLAFIRRVIAFWVWVVMRLVFWAGIGLVGALVYQRGLERTVGDIAGWARVVSEVWVREYERYQKGQGGGEFGGRDYMASSNGRSELR